VSWERIRLGDCCEITSSKRIFYSEYTDYGIPFYRSKEIIEFSQGQSISEPLYIANQRYHEIKNRFGVPVAGDMLLTSVGTIGIPYIVKETDEFYFKDGNLTWFRNFTSKLCARYLYYWVISKEGNGVLNNTTIGSSQKALTISALKNVEITVPSIGKQRRIADILSAYDDLIENNRKQIKLLEEAAQRLYKEWFVDLRFPGHEHTKIVDGVPEGWKPCTLDDVIEFDPKVRLDKDSVKQFVPMSALSTSSMVLDINEIIETKSNSGSKFQNGDTLLARITPCLENGKTAFVYGLESDEGAVGSTEYIVMRSKRLNPYMVYLLSRTSVFRQAAINSMSGSDGRQRVKADKLKALAYLLAPTGLIHIFERIASPMFEMIFELNKQIFATTEARDRLLPKMMSEEVEV
jgi:type I restriction enzyme S subunit